MQIKKDKKKIGLLTMHRVLNFGSILQAYATQVAIEKLGYYCEIIDYQYPNKIHTRDYSSPIIKIIRFLMEIRYGFPGRKKRKSFQQFRERCLHQSDYFDSRESLRLNVPIYDSYVVGSDQTWNVRHIGNDDTFLLAFAPKDKRRVSYASSAARRELPTEYVESFKTHLSSFQSISVREKNTQELVKRIIGKDVPITIDPTLLLDKDDWRLIANTSKLNIQTPFILVYILKYSFSPYPIATEVIQSVYEKYKLPVVVIRYSAKEKIGIRNVIDLHEGIGPEDFLWLFMNASFVVTTSFHGTIFSLNFKKPFYTIYDSRIEDDRIYSILHLLDAESCGVDVCKGFYPKYETIDYTTISTNLEVERRKSMLYLKNNLID